MKRQWIYKWEKHNVLQFVQQNYVLNHYDSKLGYVNGEFTVNTIFKDVPNVDGLYGWGFTKIERYLCELAQEGYLSVRYASKQANLEYRYGKPKNIGSKTVAIYTVN